MPPLKLLEAARKKKIKKYVDGTGLPSFTFTPLGSGVQGEMSDDTNQLAHRCCACGGEAPLR